MSYSEVQTFSPQKNHCYCLIFLSQAVSGLSVKLNLVLNSLFPCISKNGITCICSCSLLKFATILNAQFSVYLVLSISSCYTTSSQNVSSFPSSCYPSFYFLFLNDLLMCWVIIQVEWYFSCHSPSYTVLKVQPCVVSYARIFFYYCILYLPHSMLCTHVCD